jgi:TonB family protein
MAQEPGTAITETLGSLKGCLVEGDAEQRMRERRIRRRALGISIAMQSATLAALLIVPLFGKTEHIALGIVTPIRPYSGHVGPSHSAQEHHPGGHQSICHFCVPRDISPIVAVHGNRTEGNLSNEPNFDPVGPTGNNFPDGIPLGDTRKGPTPPDTTLHKKTDTPPRLVVGRLEPAMLIRRIEPIYPPLAIQIGRAGRVELRAIIATDGTVQSLQVVEGDPLFVKSALDAVGQWRYKPTVLNGQPVEIDTHITVIYTLQR